MASGLKSLRVLLVDADTDRRAIVLAALDGAGVTQTREASDGAEGLDVLRDWPAGLAIVGVQMSPLDGVAFTRMVRNGPSSRNPYLPIIMMTEAAEHPRLAEARGAGVTEFVARPLTATAVLDRIHAVIYRPRPFVRTADYFGPHHRPDSGAPIRVGFSPSPAESLWGSRFQASSSLA